MELRELFVAGCLFLLLCAGAYAGPSLSLVIDFETDSPAPYTIAGARVTDSPGSVLSGDRSLLADSRTSRDEWHEFFVTTPEVRFERESTYLVTFDYRILDPGGPKTNFYSLLRSRSGGDIYGHFWLWNREQGAEGTIRRLFRTGEKDDWMLIIGIRHQGALIIDNVSVTRIQGRPAGWGLPVKPGRTDLIETAKSLNRQRINDGLDELTADMLIVWCNEGAGIKIVESRAEYARQHVPDFVDWNPCGPLAKDFGVRTSSGGPEYQELYRIEAEEIWDTRYQRFADNGFARSLDGTTIRDETWGEGGYFTCHNGQGWHNWFVGKLLVKTQKLMGICQDNIACAPFLKGYGCFCEPCLSGFRSWLKSRYSSEELGAFGIDDAGSFDFAEWVARWGLIGNDALLDPVVREYIKFQHVSNLESWARVVSAVREESNRLGFPRVCYGNQIGAAGWWPYAVAVGQLCDVIEIEDVFGVSDRIPNRSLQYKMGRASGWEEKQVWVRGPVYDDNVERAPCLSPVFWRTHFAEALANGGVRTISFGMNAPWTGDPETLDFIDSPAIREVWKQYSEFCRANRAVFTRRESLAKTALVYSLPTMMFRRFYPLEIDDNSVFGEFDSAARLLDENHIPYDCVVFGHPEIFQSQISRLSRYDTLFLPAADALTDTQVDILRQFVRRGGTLIVGRAPGIFDENLNLRPGGSPLSDLDYVDINRDRDAAMKKLRESSLLTVNAPSSVTANLWWSANGASVDVHLVNYAGDPRDQERKGVGPLRLEVTLPAGFRFDTARLLTFGRPPAELDFRLSGSRVTITVPPFEDYAVVSFADRRRIDAANAEAESRRAADRERVKKLAAEKDLY